MKVEDISINKIISGENIRQKYDNDELNSLMQTIKDNGLLQPIGLKELKDDKYIILWGNRRLAACKKLGYKTIPAAIYSGKDDDMSEEEFIIINGIENLQQSPNSLFELGRVCKILRKTMSISQIAIRLGISSNRVENALTEMSRIPVKWQKHIKILDNRNEAKKGNIPISAAMRVTQMRGANSKTKDKLFEYLHKNDTNLQHIELVTSLVQNGEEVNDAIKMANKFTSFNISLFCDKVALETELSKFNSNIDFIVHVLNGYNPKLNAVKSIRK